MKYLKVRKVTRRWNWRDELAYTYCVIKSPQLTLLSLHSGFYVGRRLAHHHLIDVGDMENTEA